MRKINLIILAFLFVFTTINARPRNAQEAREIANRFFSKTIVSNGAQKVSSSENSVRLLYSKISGTNTGDALLYIFSKNGNNGFVIVSGDYRAREVLGYSDTNSFDPQNIPDNMKDWLSFYEAEIQQLKSSNQSTSGSAFIQKVGNSASLENSFATSVAPLLDGIKWNQGEPYNNLCPVITSTGKRTVTGCVATAMAQIMKHYNYPATGQGSNTYTSDTHKFELSADFSKVTFDWANMTNTYSSSSTEAQKNAVATLMYNCGVAVNMNYDMSSGAQSKAMAEAMRKYFKYNPNLEFYSRNYYSREEWINILKTELNAGRPLIYAGFSQEAGHQFVCDGYDANGLFHFNWGWGGSSDGYFQISALDPSEQGIGGSSGGYNGGQSIVVGLQPATGTGFLNQIHMNDTVSYPADSLLRTAAMSFGVKEIFNYGVNLFSGQIGIGLYNANNEFVSLLTKYDISELKAGYGWNSLSFSLNGLAANVQAGDYKLHVIYKKTSDIQWQKVRSVVGKPSYVNVRISSTKVYFDTPTTEAPELSLESLTLTGNLYSTKTGRLTMKIKNNGKEYNSLIGVYLQSVENDTVYQFVRTENVNLINAETRELNFNGTIELEPGNYYLAAMYDPNNHPGKAESLKSFGAIQTVEIKAAPTGTPSLYLNSKISFPNNSKVNKNFDVLSASLKNTGAYFDNKMIAFIFPTSGGSSLTYIGYQDIIIDNNETLSAQFKGAINLTPGQYMLILYHWNTATENWSRVSPNENSQIIFTLVNDYTAVNKTESKSGISIFPVPVRDFLNIKSEQRITDAQIYNIAGQLLLNSNFDNIQETQINISNLKSGSYIIRIHTSNGVETLRFVKQ
jgi:hypothetical protein